MSSPVLGAALAVAAVASLASFTSHQEAPRAGALYKNLKVLNDIPADRLPPTMLYIRAALGVQCSYCHEGAEWEKDAKPQKERARAMLRMVMELNQHSFDANLAVSCYTCHRGNVRPATAVPVFHGGPESAKAKSAAPLPTVDEVMRRYVEAAGGAPAWRRLTTRVMKGTLETSEPAVFALEIHAKAPDRFRSQFMVRVMFTDGYDGRNGWHQDNRGLHDVTGEDLAALQARAEFYGPLTLGNRYRNLRVDGRETAAGIDYLVLSGTPAAGPDHRIAFDARTGLLARIDSHIETPLGAVPGRLSFEDYRKVDGIMLPYRTVRSDAQYSYTQRFTSIRHGETVSDGLFRKPQ